MKPMIKTKYNSIDEYAFSKHASELKGQGATQLLLIYRKVLENKCPINLEPGTAMGVSTTVFLQAYGGKLVSIDKEDGSNISDSVK